MDVSAAGIFEADLVACDPCFKVTRCALTGTDTFLESQGFGEVESSKAVEDATAALRQSGCLARSELTCRVT